MSIRISGGGSMARRVVISCDTPGCPVQIEPVAAESWRSNIDASSFAREAAVGWVRAADGHDFCATHAARATAGLITAAVRQTARATGPTGEPRDRDEYASTLRARLAAAGPRTTPLVFSAAQGEVVALLLDELAGVYRGEELGALAADMAAMTRTTAASAP